MNIDFGSFSQSQASQYLNDKAELSLYIAKKFLEHIPSNFPNNSIDRINVEIATEGLLIFMIAARDGLLQQINSKLSTPLRVNQVNLRGDTFQNQLKSDPDTKFSRIWDLIENSIQEPEKVILASTPEFWEWDRSKSWLWEINKLRNRVTHTSITSQHINATAGGGISTKMNIVSLAKRPIIKLNNRTRRVLISNPKEDHIQEEDLRRYFDDCYDKLVTLKDNIKNLL